MAYAGHKFEDETIQIDVIKNILSGLDILKK